LYCCESKALIDADKKLSLTSSVAVNGRDIKLSVLNKQMNGGSIADMLNGGSSEIVHIEAKVEPLLTKVVVPNSNANGMSLGSSSEQYRLTPTVFIKSFDKPGTRIKYSLEYGLLAIAASTILLQKDKLYTALMPLPGSDLGELNQIMEIQPSGDNTFQSMPLTGNDADFQTKVSYLDKILTHASIGIIVNYKTELSTFNAFCSIVDGNASVTEKEAAKRGILEAYVNVTGENYKGAVVSKVIQFPTGVLIKSDGTTIQLEDIDALWLASNKYYAEAQQWLMSDSKESSLMIKLEILGAISARDKIDIKFNRAIGYKLILDSSSEGFVNKLVNSSGFSIESRPILELPQTRSFDDISMGSMVSAHSIGNIGNSGMQTYTGMNIIS